MGKMFPIMGKIDTTGKYVCFHYRESSFYFYICFPLLDNQSLNYVSAIENITVFPTESINASTNEKIFPPAE